MTKRYNLLAFFIIFLQPIILSAQIEIAVMGNSIAHGAYASHPFSEQLKNLLGGSYNITNLGVDGSYIFKAHNNAYWNTSAYTDAVSNNWDIVIVLFGTNEAFPGDWYTYGGKFDEDYQSLIDELREIYNPNKKFILIFPPPIISTSTAGYQMEYNLSKEIIPHIGMIAQLTNSKIVDLHDSMLGHPEWYYDGVHPNNAGHAFIAETLYNEIISWPPFIPTNFRVNQVGNTLNFKWEPNHEKDLYFYNIYQTLDLDLINNDSNIIAKVFKPDSTFQIENTSNNSDQFYYGIKAVDWYNQQSPISDILGYKANSRPVTGDTTHLVLEDNAYSFNKKDFPFIDSDSDSLVGLELISSNNWHDLMYDNNPLDGPFLCDDLSKLSFISGANQFGNSFINLEYKAIDSFGSTSLDTNRFTIDVLSVNDEPTIDPVDDIDILEDTHNQIIDISGLSAGAPNEHQNLAVQLLYDDPNLFDQFDIDYSTPNDTGQLIIHPKENVFGEHLLTIRVWDDGGTENGGIEYTDESFYLNIEPRNDPPIINTDTIRIYEDSDTTIVVGGIFAGPWESNQNILISVSSSDTEFLPTPSLSYFSPDTFALLTFTTIQNANGLTSINVSMSDDGGDALGGTSSTIHSIPVEIISVNDKPSDFNIVTPKADSTVIINKYNMNSALSITWEASTDIEEQNITYNVIFDNEFVGLSKYGLSSTSADFLLTELLAETDTVSVITDTYKIIASDGDLETEASNSGLAIKIDGRAFAPAKLNLDQNFPNPFNRTTLIGFDLPKRSAVSLSIIDMLGHEVIKLSDNEFYDRGYGTITWDGLDANYDHVPSGIYFIRINVENEYLFKKMILLK